MKYYLIYYFSLIWSRNFIPAPAKRFGPLRLCNTAKNTCPGGTCQGPDTSSDGVGLVWCLLPTSVPTWHTINRWLLSVLCTWTNTPPGVYISVRKQYLLSPFWKWYFFPSRDTSFFDSHRGLLVLIFPYFAIILPFLLPLFSFSFPFLPFSFTFYPFFFSPFHIFSPKWHRLIFFPPGAGGFSNI